MTTLDFCQKLNLSPILCQKVCEWTKANENLCKKYVPKLLANKPNHLKKLDNIAKLSIVVATLPHTLALYNQLGIDENIFWDTMSDIAIWCENDYQRFCTLGLDNIKWISKHLSLKLFRIGRLQYEFSRFVFLPNTGLKNMLHCPYRLGEKCLSIHIPQGQKLYPTACTESFIKSKEFFAKHFPNFKYRSLNIVSWVVNPNLKKILPSDSNIVRFMQMFEIIGCVPDDDMNERRIFGYKKDRQNYAPKTL